MIEATHLSCQKKIKMATSDLERALALAETNKTSAIEILGALGEYEIVHESLKIVFKATNVIQCSYLTDEILIYSRFDES